MASEIVIAAIGGGAGLATGVVASLVAPWANWGVEKRRLRRESRVQRIKEWRKGVNALRVAEAKHGKPQPAVEPSTQEGKVSFQWDMKAPDSDLVDGYTKPWFKTLKRELSQTTLNAIGELTAQPVPERVGALPNRLDEEISRIERDKWKLV